MANLNKLTIKILKRPFCGRFFVGGKGLEIARISIEQLNVASYNPRIDLKLGDNDYEKLKKSILTFGYIDPIIVNKQGNVVVGGHQRLKILQEMGRETVEVSLVDLSLDQEKALNLALNKTGGDWDMRNCKICLVNFKRQILILK